MELGKLKKKVAREFAKSPAKTVILIALCPVALYFLVPLFVPASSKIDDAQRVKVITTNVVPSSTPTEGLAPALVASGRPSWRQLNEWIGGDWRRQSATITLDQRDPFQPASQEQEEAVTAAEEVATEAEPSPAPSPAAFAALGLRLTGTLVGRHSRSATINGRRYLEGDEVKLARHNSSDAAIEHGLVLRQIGARHAILESDGTRYRLELRPAQPVDNGIIVVRGPTGDSN